jgi:NAD(P)-dependent dehydrogenase (short-subunit alcohol dehydrogenase family)
MGTRYVLVTGASTGIGRACALALAKEGFHVFAGVRKASDADSLRVAGGANVEPITLDVTKQDEIDAARALIEARTAGAGLAGLVNNAGVAVAGPFEFIPMQDFRRQLEINVFGQIMVTQSFMPLIRTARGRVCFIGSTGGYFSAPFMAPYSASKYCIEAFVDSLRVELAPWGIQVSVIQPGAIQTEIWEKSKADADDLLSRLPPEAITYYGKAIDAIKEQVEKTVKYAVPADHVARSVVHALTATRPRTRYRVGIDAFIQFLLARCLPDRVRDVLIRKMLGV